MNRLLTLFLLCGMVTQLIACSETNSVPVAIAMGGIAGGLTGSALGKGAGKTFPIALGAVTGAAVGALIGKAIDDTERMKADSLAQRDRNMEKFDHPRFFGDT